MIVRVAGSTSSLDQGCSGEAFASASTSGEQTCNASRECGEVLPIQPNWAYKGGNALCR